MTKKIIIGFVIVSIIGFIFCYPKKEKYIVKEQVLKSIVVEIKGQVKKPGFYTVTEGSNLGYLINLAGGLLSDALLDDLKMNQIVEKKTYYIKRYEKNNIEEKINKVNINKAKLEELTKVPFINEKKALNILFYRKTNKEFKTLEEIVNVDGIGKKSYEKIKKYFII